MAAVLFVLLALMQTPADGPVRTAPAVPRPQAPPAAMTTRPGAQAPADDYGYVAWCFGAVETYLALYDRVMPEVTRIERAFPSPRGIAEDLKVYPLVRDQARKDLIVFRDAIIATEKASPRPISTYGAASMRAGRAVWTGSDKVTPAQLAREWMGWTPPARCEQTAKALTVKSTVLGQALIFNAGPTPEAPPEPPAAVTPVETPPAAPPPTPRRVVATAPAPAPAARAIGLRPLTPDAPVRTATAPIGATPAAAPLKPAPKPATTVPAAPPKGAFVMDPDSDKGCPGRIDASIRAGQLVMMCMP